MKYSLVLIAVVFAVASAQFSLKAPSKNDRVIMEEGWTPDFDSDKWELLDTPVDLDAHRSPIFMLKQRNVEFLKARLVEISDHTHPDYGKYYTLEELAELMRPARRTFSVVTRFLKEAGIHEHRLPLSRDMLQADICLGMMQKLFNVTFHNYRHIQTGKVAAGTFDQYSLPIEVAAHVDFVTMIQGLPELDQPLRKKAPAAQAGDDITPTVIRNRYNISGSLVCKNSKSTNAVAEFQAQYYSPSDLQQFFTQFVPFSDADTVAKVVGTNNVNDPGTEASLDIQYLMGTAPNATTWFYGMKSFNFYNDLVQWLQELNNETDCPWVHSVSYGSQGNYPSESYMTRSDTEYQKLGARGITIIYASGDSGAECREQCKQYWPSYPAISPHVTSIGATRFCNGGNSGSECAVQLFKSGGGMAPTGTFSTPSWQSFPVSDYFGNVSNTPTPSAINKNGRGTPDFAALGDEHFQVVDHGRVVSVGGTSCSAPVFAAVVTLLNDIRFSAGKSSLGYLNPTMYQWVQSTANSFFDVTEGDNENGCQNSACAPYLAGYLDAPGWDPVTGYGTPNFGVLSTMV